MFKFYKRAMLSLVSLLLASVIILTGCSSTQSSDPLERQMYVLGTLVSISLYDHQSESLLDQVSDKLEEYENILSINKTGTLIDEINLNAGKSPVKVDDDTYGLIKKGLYYSELSNGSFDITVGPLVKLWNIGFSDKARVPSEEEILQKLPLVGYKNVILNDAEKTVFLTQEGMLLDLGGIGKGYVADEIAAFLRQQGVEHAIINLGGNVYTLGNKPGNKLWTIGIQDPFNPRGKKMGTVKVENKSLVTSGIYERYIADESGKKYHHILNPATGYPYENEITGVTIISDSSTDGDALSTAVFSMGIEKGLAFVESLEGIDAIFISTDHKVYLSSGLKDKFVLTSDAFSIQ